MDINNICINNIRGLCLDMVEEAKSGHLGMSLGSAEMGFYLFKNHLNINPQETNWLNRDRFILSAGHGTPLLYALMHIFGFNLGIEDLKQFRKLGSKTPGHPEYGNTEGVEVSTGPLGQGLAMSVGMAIAEKHLEDKYNKDDLKLINHNIYTICGDGDLMEGVANEAIAIAGKLKLNNLILLYDSNDICSDGKVKDSTIDDIKLKFTSMGWNYQKVEAGYDEKTFDKFLEVAKCSDKPVIIEFKNIIGKGSTYENTNKIHSDAVGEEEVCKIKHKFGIPNDKFFVYDEVKEFRDNYIENSKQKYDEWLKTLEEYKSKYPSEYYDLFEKIKQNLDDIDLPKFDSKISTRVASGKVLNYFNEMLGNLIGGSADLANSNKTILDNSSFMNENDASGNNIHFGIREFAMASIINGITTYGGLRGYCATFLVFSDYMRSAIRQAALMKINPIYIFTHDSVILGYDGPTHQPIEQLQSLRAMPDVDVIRPCDANETVYAWKYALKNDKPTILVLGRQDVDIIDGSSYENLEYGGYLIENPKDFIGTIIATGSEVGLAKNVVTELKKEDKNFRLVNLASWEIFERQEQEYKDSVIDKNKPVFSIEASSGFGWERYTKDRKHIISIDEYGESGNGEELYKKRGFSVENILGIIKKNI